MFTDAWFPSLYTNILQGSYYDRPLFGSLVIMKRCKGILDSIVLALFVPYKKPGVSCPKNDEENQAEFESSTSQSVNFLRHFKSKYSLGRIATFY